MANAYRDENSVPTLIASSNVDGFTPIRIYADPVTHRLLVDSIGGGGGLSEITVSGTVNGSNQTFTALTTPTYLVIDGSWYKKMDNKGNVQWSISGTTITTLVTPNDSIYGF